MSLASSHTHGNVGRTRAVLLTQKMSPITDHRLTTPSGALTVDPYPGPRSPSLPSPHLQWPPGPQPRAARLRPVKVSLTSPQSFSDLTELFADVSVGSKPAKLSGGGNCQPSEVGEETRWR